MSQAPALEQSRQRKHSQPPMTSLDSTLPPAAAAERSHPHQIVDPVAAAGAAVAPGPMRQMSALIWKMRQPFNAVSHLLGMVLAIYGLQWLLAASAGQPDKQLGFAIYGASATFLYLASTLYHLLPVKAEMVERLRRLDQCAIYLFVAGSITPLALVSLRGLNGRVLLDATWTIAALAILAQICWRNMPCALSVTLYLLMGFLSLAFLGPISHVLTAAGFRWLVLGDVIYAVGAVIFATEKPRLWPPVFGFHELWHVMVMAASAAHFMVMLTILSQRLSG